MSGGSSALWRQQRPCGGSGSRLQGGDCVDRWRRDKRETGVMAQRGGPSLRGMRGRRRSVPTLPVLVCSFVCALCV